MNLHLLRLFKEVAVAGSFSRAAEVLHISQPAVSKGVRELEAQLDCALLERGPGGVRVTQAGAALLVHANTIFTEVRAADETLRALRGLESGSLSIGASTTIATYFLPSLVGRFHQAHPGVELHIHAANTREIAELLRAREIDMALVEGPVDDTQFAITPWRVDHLVGVAAPSHPLAQASRDGAPLTPASIGDGILIIREPGSGTREVVLEALEGAHVPLGRRMEVNSTGTMTRLVAAGVGMAFVSEAAVQDHVARGALVVLPFAGLAMARTLTRLALHQRQDSAAARAFGELLDSGSHLV